MLGYAGWAFAIITSLVGVVAYLTGAVRKSVADTQRADIATLQTHSDGLCCIEQTGAVCGRLAVTWVRGQIAWWSSSNPARSRWEGLSSIPSS
jgi:hypothetical protein